MSYETISIMLHKACNAECEMCCTESSPRCKEKLDIEKVKDHIRSTAEIQEIEEIAITGGEAFLDYPKLLEVVELINETGKRSNIMTNGFWADTYENAYYKLKELKKRGLYIIGTSCDHFHSEYIPLKNIKNLIRAANDLSIYIGLNLIYSKNKSVTNLLNEFQDELEYAGITTFQWQAVGRAEENLSDKNIERFKTPEQLFCPNKDTYVIRYDKKIFPCCAPYVFKTGFYLDDFEEMNAKSVIDKLSNNRILMMLKKRGFKYFMNIIRKNNIKIEIPEFIQCPCELCSKLFAKENIWKLYPYIYEDMNV